MPWDPVRHAMQEVSVNPKNGLTPLTPTAPTLIIPPNSALTSSPPSTTTPRATSLAMLLNDSTTYRSSPSPVMTRPGLPASLSSPSSSLNQLMNPVSPTRKPLSLEQNPDQKPKAVLMPPPKPSSPYNPQRISTAGSVLVPLSVSERRIFSSPVNSLRMALVKHPDQRVGGDSKDEHFPSRQQNGSNGGYSPSQAQSSRQWETDNQRKRKREETGDEDRDSPLKRSRGQDEKAVAYHYNQRPEIGVSGRRKSPIFGLKAFNNWIKSVLIQKMAHEPLSQSSFRRKTPRNATLSGRVLDIGCGKGGDLQKWKNAGIKEYVGLDLAIMSVNQARDRWLKWNGDKFEATFTQLDCYTHYLSEAEDLRPRILSEPFDVVTMQFCMHYAFETEEKVRIMLDNVTRYLRPGGRFVGTIPNSDILHTSLDEAREQDPDALSFGNEVYNVRFDSYEGPLYGHRYIFFLADAVGDVPEYVVYWKDFVKLAKEFGLKLLYKREFHQVFEEEREDPEYSRLLKRMEVMDDNNNSAMDPAQWDAANVYLAFAFEKI